MVWGIAIVLWGVAIQIMLTASSQYEWFISGLAGLLAGMGVLWFWLTTRYKLYKHSMTLMSGPFFKRINYADITSVRDGHKAKGLSFAFSWDCLQIDVIGF